MKYVPELEGPIKGWAVNHCRRHYWRVKRHIQWDDLMQEAAVTFLKVKQAYPDLDGPSHFMALFQRSWANRVNDFAHEDTHERMFVDVHISSEDNEDAPLHREYVGDTDTYGELSIKLKQAPREVVMVLNLLLNAPVELVEIAMQGWNGRDKRCIAGGSKRICKMLGLPPSLDVMGMVETYFRP